MRRAMSLVVLLCGGLAAGCNSAGERKALSSPSPVERARATVTLAEQRDAASVHKLVDLLEDPDQAVRMYAIIALRRLTGEDYGYRYYAREAERRPAVERWRAALRDGQVVLRTDGSAAPKTAAAAVTVNSAPASAP